MLTTKTNKSKCIKQDDNNLNVHVKIDQLDNLMRINLKGAQL